MPLSEEEQRILQDIERSFYESDPDFAQTVTDGVFNRAARNTKIAALGFGLSLGVLLMMFARVPVVGLLGFVGMVACAAIFVQNSRRMFRARIHEGERSAVGDLKTRFRGRFPRG